MDMHDIRNDGLDFALAGKTYRVKRISVSKLLSDFEKEVKEEYKNNISDMKELVPEKDRISFIRQAMQDIPTGKKLDELASGKMGSIAGGLKLLFEALNTCQSVSMDECVKLSGDEYAEEITPIIAYALGQDKDKKDPNDLVAPGTLNGVEDKKK